MDRLNLRGTWIPMGILAWSLAGSLVLWSLGLLPLLWNVLDTMAFGIAIFWSAICWLGHLIHALLYLLIILGTVALYFCPSEESFHKWLVQQVALCQLQRQIQYRAPDARIAIEWVLPWFRFSWVQTISSMVINASVTPVFFNYGIFRLAWIQSSNSNEPHQTFLGIFNVWLPWSNYTR